MAVTPRMIDAGVHIGEIFLEKYRVDSILGHGGMGIVALCTHLALNERVAIKMLRRDVLDDADAVERFMREAQAASKLRSEYVARVTDVGRSTKNVPYMVMEYLEGHDLGELLDERGSLAQTWAVELTLQACEALAEAHSIGIVHRDVKPSNLFVTWRPDGSALVKVLDFGISKALNGTAMQLTQTQSMLGTPAYMSPEQMRSARTVDARTDIWSLGTVLYEVLEGRRPFEAESFSEMCVKVAVDPPGPMKQTPPALQQVVLRCLEKLPELRYASMAELGRALVGFSHDPHQAQILVERMTRTLRRSQLVDRDPANNATAAHEQRSAERRAELAAGLSNPALVLPGGPLPGPSQPAAPALAAVHITAASAAEPSLSQTFAIARPRRRTTVAILAATVAATAIGVLISLSGGAPAPRDPAAPPSIVAPRPLAVEPAAVGSAAEQRVGESAVPGRAADHLVRDAAVGEPNAGSAIPDVSADEARAVPPGPAAGGRKVNPTRPALDAAKPPAKLPAKAPAKLPAKAPAKLPAKAPAKLPANTAPGATPAATSPCDDEDPFGDPHGTPGSPCPPSTVPASARGAR